MIPQTLIEVDLSGKGCSVRPQKGGLVMFKHFFTTVVLGGVALLLAPVGVASATWTLIDDFSDGKDDGWTRIDGSAGEPWGPGTYDASSGVYHLLGGGVVPLGQAGWMASTWDQSSDPLYSDGFLRAKIRSNDETALVMLVLRNSEYGTYYAFGANPVNGVFYMSKFLDGPEVDVHAVVPEERFRSGEDWILEAGAIGDQLSIKAWKPGEPEPSKPQWTYRDPSPLPRGILGVITWHWGLEQTPPGTVDVTYDDIYFHPPVPGDFDSNRLVDVRDIDLLSREVRLGRYRPQLDLNDDDLVNLTDHAIWVHDLKDTWYGDADLNGEFNSADFVLVFQEGLYETTQDAGWAKGDWDGSGIFDSSDFVIAFQDGGYEQGPPTDMAAVPEPGAWTLLVLGVGFWLFGRRTCPI